MKNNKRIEWIDSMKGILILFVILSHTYPAVQYRRFFTPFFLTMFFWASGYTFSVKNDFKEFMYGKIKRLIIPFCILGSIRVMITYILSAKDIWSCLKDFVLQISCKGDEMWFVSCLFVSSLLFYIIVKVSAFINCQKKNEIIIVVSAWLLILGLFDMKVLKIKCIWEAEIACMMTFYMALGFYCRREEAKFNKIIKNGKVAIWNSLIYIAIVFGISNDVDIHAEQFIYPFLFVINSILVIIPVLQISRMICMTKIKKYFVFLGQNTIFYYAFGGIVRIILYMLLKRIGITPDQYVTPILCTMMTAVLLAVPAKLTRKYIPYAVGA